MLHVTAPVPSGWGTARVSTGCATPCRSRARHWQLAAGPGAGSGKARHKTDHKQAQICLLRRMPNQSHTTTSPQLPEWPVSRLVGRPHWQLAAGPGAGIGKARDETDHTQAQICLLRRMPNQLHTITSPQLPEWPVSRSVGRPHWQLAAGPGAGSRQSASRNRPQTGANLSLVPYAQPDRTRSPLHSWQSGLCQGRLGAHTGSWPQAQARGVGKARHETDHKQAQICLLCRMPNQLHTITSSQLPEWPVSRLVGRPHWQLAAGPGAVVSKARHKTDHTQAQICLLCRMPIQLHRSPSPQLPEWPVSRLVGRPQVILPATGGGTGSPIIGSATDPKFKQPVRTGRPQASPAGPEGLGCLECACQAPPQPPAVKGLLGKGAVRRARGAHGSAGVLSCSSQLALCPFLRSTRGIISSLR